MSGQEAGPRGKAVPQEPKEQGEAAAVAPRGRQALEIGLLCLLVCASFLPAANGGFVWDDQLFLNAAAVQDPSGLSDIWFHPSKLKRSEGHYWPAVYTTFWIEHKLWGFDPRGYHIVNILLHLANTLLLFRIMLRSRVPGAWAIAAVFAVHPVHVESVAWVIERKDVLSGLFYLSAALAWLRYCDRGRGSQYVLALGLFGLGLLSKSIVVTLPAALLIWQWFRNGRVTSLDVVRTVPFFLLAAALTAVDLAHYRSLESISFDYSVLERALIASRAVWFYFTQLLWPANLMVIYPSWDVSVDNLAAWTYLATALAAAGLLWAFRSRTGRGPLAGALYFVITLSPVLGFVDYGYMEFSFVADRYQYLASIGVIVAIVGSAMHLASRLADRARLGATAAGTVVILLLASLTWRQSGIYKDDITFYRHIAGLHPEAHRVQYNLGNALLNEEGRIDEAIEAFRGALAVNPRDADARTNLGLALSKAGDEEGAEEQYRLALEIDPKHADAMVNLGNSLLGQEGRVDEAIASYRRALEVDPEKAVARTNLGLALSAAGDAEGSQQQYRSALEVDPRNMEALSKLGLWAFQEGDWSEAGEYYRRALEINPGNMATILQLAAIRSQQERHDEALDLYRSASEIDPNASVPIAGTARELQRMGRHQEAIDQFEIALATSETEAESALDRSRVRMDMGLAFEGLGQPAEAAQQYELAIEQNPRQRDAINNLALIRTREQRFEEAIRLYDLALEVDPELASAHVGKGVALFQTGQPEDALRHFETALSLDPDLASARSNRDRVRALLRSSQP